MRTRRLGRTGLDLSECTLGTGALARSDPKEAAAMVAQALAAGINAIEIDATDAAAVRLVGEAVRREGAGQRLHVLARAGSLVPFDLPSPHVSVQAAYPGAQLRAQAEALLATLGVERLALVQLHAWCPEWLHEGDWLETLGRLRAEGKIAGIGISLFDHDVDAALEAVAGGAVDAVQLLYNIFDPGAARALLPLCAKHGVGVIARSPLYFGALAPGPGGRLPDWREGDWRHDYFYAAHHRETEDRVQRLAGVASSTPVPELAMRFALSNPAVTGVVVGMRTRGQLAATLQAFSAGPLTHAECAALGEHAWLC
jgi:aryl-alcohol dehydrogenase-like predicted oxidoreductase